MIFELSVYSLLVSAAICLEPRGCNVCFKEEVIVVQKNHSIRENHHLIVRDNKPCSELKHILNSFQWCKDFHLIEEEKRTVKYCCEGYTMDLSDLRCKPVCNQGCFQGTCVEPNVCQCHHGLRGEACNLTCPLDKWGSGCENDCHCANEADCNPTTGACRCTRGWKGENCSEPCAEGYHGQFCSEVCSCQNNALCDHVTGSCNCTAGYQGPLCEEKCNNGSHGYECTDECKCQNDALCHHEDGTCECKAGWTGLICADRCEEGWYGVNCSDLCQCYNNATCDFVTGECTCSSGFYGESCEIECTPGTWGLNCSQKCECTYGNCDHINGICNCFPGFVGGNCQDRVCPSRKWGQNCSSDCGCKPEVECHPVTGECWCASEDEDCYLPDKVHSDKRVLVEDKEETNIWKIISVICISVLVLQLIIIGVTCSKRCPLQLHLSRDSSSLPTYLQLMKEEQH